MDGSKLKDDKTEVSKVSVSEKNIQGHNIYLCGNFY